MTQNNRFLILTVILVSMLVTACHNNVTFNRYVAIKHAQWQYGDAVTIEIPIQDTLSYYDLFINLRNTNDYPYSNLFLIARMTFPDKTRITDTLEYEMTDPKGRFLGSGFTDLKENKLFYKSHIRFPVKGNYLFEVKHAMRQRNQLEGIDPLNGVSDIGVSVEKKK